MKKTSFPPKITVAPHRGALALHVDDIPHTGLAFWHRPGPSGITEWKEFDRCGLHFFQLDLNCWSRDTSDWENTLSSTLEAVPEARIWLRVYASPPTQWLQEHPEHTEIHYDEKNGDAIRKFVAFASPLWRQAAADNLQRLVEYMESHHASRIWAYNIQAGDCGEWAYSWSQVCSGYSPVQVEAWQAWLRNRYAEVSRLRDAWADRNVDFASALPPSVEQRTRPVKWPPVSLLFDPVQDKRCIDWLTFHGWAQATALADLAAAARRALRTRGHQKLISAFHGYHIWPYASSCGPCNAGFSDLDPVLTSPDIDALCTPLGYIHRNSGGLYSHHNLATTIRLHGKLFYTEDDTFTHRAKWTPWRYSCRDAAETRSILRRNLAGVLSEGSSQWWMDHNSEDWFVDEETEASLAEMVQLAGTALQQDRTPVSEVAFLTSESSFRLLRQSPELIDLLWPQTQSQLLRIGAPVDFVRIQDLARAKASGDADRWKFIVVGGCLWLEPHEKQILQQILCGNGRHILFLHGQGICDGTRLDPALTSELSGIKLAEYPHGGPFLAEANLAGNYLSWGTDRDVVPILHTNDEEAEVLGWLERQYSPVFARKAQVGWTSIWCGVPGVPWQILGALAEAAGVHRFLKDGSQVMANSGLLAVHAAGDVLTEISLPYPEILTDSEDNLPIEPAKELPVHLRRGETKIWLRSSG